MNNLVFILNFHGLGPVPSGLSSGEEDCWLDQSFFEGILDSVRERKDIRITFDDANESDFTIAFPALQARNMRAKFFAVAQRLDQKRYLSAGQLQTMSEAGMGVGNHGMSHRRWTELDSKDLHEELVEAKDKLVEVVGRPIPEAACPYGSYNRRVLASLRKVGYETVYTSDQGPALAGGWLQPRNTVRRTHDLAYVQAITTRRPAGFKKVLRDFKLMLKRLR